MSRPNPIPGNKPFPKGKSGNPNGRPRKIRNILTEQGYRLDEIHGTIKGLLALPPGEVEEYHNREDCTTLEAIVARSLTKAFKTGDTRNLDTLLGRTFGPARVREDEPVADPETENLREEFQRSARRYEEVYRRAIAAGNTSSARMALRERDRLLALDAFSHGTEAGKGAAQEKATIELPGGLTLDL